MNGFTQVAQGRVPGGRDHWSRWPSASFASVSVAG